MQTPREVEHQESCGSCHLKHVCSAVSPMLLSGSHSSCAVPYSSPRSLAAQRPSVGASVTACVCRITAPVQQSLPPQLSAFLLPKQAPHCQHGHSRSPAALPLHPPGPHRSGASEAVWGGGCFRPPLHPSSLLLRRHGLPSLLCAVVKHALAVA